MLLAHGAAMVVHNAIYTSTLRVDLGALGKSRKTLLQWDGFAWIDLYEPTEEELRFVTREFDLQPLTVESYQWEKIEHYAEKLRIELKPSCFVEETYTVKFGHIHTFVGADLILTMRYGEASELHNLRQVAERETDKPPRGSSAVLYMFMGQVVDGYSLVVAALQNALEVVRMEVFSNSNLLYRIHRLYREGLQLRAEARTLTKILERLAEDKSLAIDTKLRWYPSNIRSQFLRVTNNIEGLCNYSGPFCE